MLANGAVFSVSRESNRAAKATMGVATGPRRFPEKLSESLVNNPLWVNNRVRLEARKQPFRTSSMMQASPTASSHENPSEAKLLDRMAQTLRSRHYSRRTEQTYCHWVKRYIFFHKVRHPAEMAEVDSVRLIAPSPPNPCHASIWPRRTRPAHRSRPLPYRPSGIPSACFSPFTAEFAVDRIPIENDKSV
jgi:hypothetical protein